MMMMMSERVVVKKRNHKTNMGGKRKRIEGAAFAQLVFALLKSQLFKTYDSVSSIFQTEEAEMSESWLIKKESESSNFGYFTSTLQFYEDLINLSENLGSVPQSEQKDKLIFELYVDGFSMGSLSKKLINTYKGFKRYVAG